MNKQWMFFIAFIVIVCMLCVTVGALSKNKSATQEKNRISPQVLTTQSLGVY